MKNSNSIIMKAMTKGYILEADVKYPKELHELHNDLPFLPKRLKIDMREKLVCKLCIKKNCHTHKCSKAGSKSWASNTRKRS